jgi:hypothetical protein
VKRGYRVLLPFGVNQRYDLVIDTGKRFLRDYRGDADLFLVYCPETDRVYALDVREAAASQAVLRVDPTANNQVRGIRWAAEYELPA